MASDEGLTAGLHAVFCRFQVRAKGIEAWVEATQTPVDTGTAREVLEEYSRALGTEIQAARDELRRGRWADDGAVRARHDTLCFCLAVWELVHEMVVGSGPSAAGLLRWYNRHYLDEDLAEWWQQARARVDGGGRGEQGARGPGAAADAELWRLLCRLALSDRRAEVLALLERLAAGAAADPHLCRVCELLRRAPSLRQMEEARASAAEFARAVEEARAAARGLLRELPTGHAARPLLEVYAGAGHEAFEAGGDVARRLGRTWVEDLVYAHAWAFPSLRRAELGELLRAVARRRAAEAIDDVDRVLFAALSLDVPTLLSLLASLPERFPAFFVAHLVDVLYYAGRVPPAQERGGGGGPRAPPRDWHLMAYAKELSAGPRAHQRRAIDYLRAGGSRAAAELLEAAAEAYCAGAGTDGEMEEALALLADLGLGPELGRRWCRRRAEALRARGDLAGCLSWACRAEEGGAPPRGAGVSELLDSLAQEDAEGLLALLAPAPDDEEPLERYPPRALLALLARGAASARPAPSGRLYFFTQLARCRALRRAGRPARAYAPALARLAASGAAPAYMLGAVLEELLPALAGDEPALAAEEALLLMRHVQAAARDPLHRAQLAPKAAELHRAMGASLSRAVLSGPGGYGVLPRSPLRHRAPAPEALAA